MLIPGKKSRLCGLLAGLTLSVQALADPPSTIRSLDEWLLFYPARYPAGSWEPRGLGQQDIWFQAADGTRLHGWLFPSEQPRATVLYLHGNGGNLSHRAQLMAQLQRQLNISIFIPDYRGYGRSVGTPTVSGVLSDARAARKALAQQQGVTEADVVLMGRSLGGALAVQLAAELNPPALILESTFNFLRAVAAEHYAFLSWVFMEPVLRGANYNIANIMAEELSEDADEAQAFTDRFQSTLAQLQSTLNLDPVLDLANMPEVTTEESDAQP